MSGRNVSVSELLFGLQNLNLGQEQHGAKSRTRSGKTFGRDITNIPTATAPARKKATRGKNVSENDLDETLDIIDDIPDARPVKKTPKRKAKVGGKENAPAFTSTPKSSPRSRVKTPKSKNATLDEDERNKTFSKLVAASATPGKVFKPPKAKTPKNVSKAAKTPRVQASIWDQEQPDLLVGRLEGRQNTLHSCDCFKKCNKNCTCRLGVILLLIIIIIIILAFSFSP